MHTQRTLLVLRKLAAAIVDEALRVNEPNALTRLFLAEALELEEALELHADANASGAGAEEQNAVVGERAA